MDKNQDVIVNAPVIIRRRKSRSDSENPLDQSGKICERLDLLLEELRNANRKKYTGYIKVNFSQGSVGRVEKFEEILKK